jgi:peptide/nickel transport system ATP-binding protein
VTTIMDVRGLTKTFTIRPQLFAPPIVLNALVDIDLNLQGGETLAIVGESGCGKTTLGRCLVRAQRPSSGEIIYSAADGETIGLHDLSDRELRPWRRDIRMIFQDPMSSLNPHMRVFDIVAEPLRINMRLGADELQDRVADILGKVGLPADAMQRFPHAFSGGQRQRIGIARALVLNPRLVIADEAVSALDVSVQAQVLNLLQDIKDELGLTYIFISHDLGVVNYIADRVAVMYLGHLVELAPTEALFDRPRHPYTEVLLDALPIADPSQRSSKQDKVQGEIPFLGDRPSGCPFHTRCRYAQDRCRAEKPVLRAVGGQGHSAACHFADELELQGAFPE